MNRIFLNKNGEWQVVLREIEEKKGAFGNVT
jgi:hypothetical protein